MLTANKVAKEFIQIVSSRLIEALKSLKDKTDHKFWRDVFFTQVETVSIHVTLVGVSRIASAHTAKPFYSTKNKDRPG